MESVEIGNPSCWYGYNIRYYPNIATEQYELTIFSQDYPNLEAVGHDWSRVIYYSSWFATKQDASEAALAFCTEMHWRSEATALGVGEELSNRAEEEIIKVGAELKRLWKEDPDELAKRVLSYHQQQQERKHKQQQQEQVEPENPD